MRDYHCRITSDGMGKILLDQFVKNYQYYQKLSYLLSGEGVGVIAAEDEELAVTEDLLRSAKRGGWILDGRRSVAWRKRARKE